MSEKLIPGTLIAWDAAGPGWANAGVTATVRDENTHEERRLTLYAEHFDPTILRIAIEAIGRLEAQYSAALIKAEKSRRRRGGA